MAGCFQLPSPDADVVQSREIALDPTMLDSLSLYAPVRVREFYKKANNTLVWLDTSGVLPHGDTLIRFIRRAAYYGLTPAHYRSRLLQDQKQVPVKELDVYLTDSFFALATHLHHGRVDPQTLNIVDVDGSTDSTHIGILVKAIRDNKIRQALESFEPGHRPYHDLKTALNRRFPGEVDPDSLSDEHRRELFVAQLNLERWRWQKTTMPRRRIEVNVPSYLLRVVENDSVILESRVIVGKKETPTPELKSVIRQFIIYPYWHVPRSILREILPGIQADSTYMDRRNYQVLGHDGKIIDHRTLDWQSYTAENFPYILRQREGDENTMGVLKFVFANNYNVYLHDTNARGLFSREHRALSHGCVRVQRAVDLARYLAKDDDVYVGPEDLDQYLQVKAKMTVNVVKPIPLWLIYFTASVENGSLVFYEDIYEKDRQLADALYHFELHVPAVVRAPLM